MNTPARINLNQTATAAAAAVKLAEASGDAQAIKAAVISHAYVSEREAKEANDKARAYCLAAEAAAEAAYKDGRQELAGGGDCFVVIKAEGARAAFEEAEKELKAAKEYRASVMFKFNR